MIAYVALSRNILKDSAKYKKHFYASVQLLLNIILT